MKTLPISVATARRRSSGLEPVATLDRRGRRPDAAHDRERRRPRIDDLDRDGRHGGSDARGAHGRGGVRADVDRQDPGCARRGGVHIGLDEASRRRRRGAHLRAALEPVVELVRIEVHTFETVFAVDDDRQWHDTHAEALAQPVGKLGVGVGDERDHTSTIMRARPRSAAVATPRTCRGSSPR